MTEAPPTTALTKRYGSRTVVDAADLLVPSGAVAGFIGPNGAGKTTAALLWLMTGRLAYRAARRRGPISSGRDLHPRVRLGVDELDVAVRVLRAEPEQRGR